MLRKTQPHVGKDVIQHWRSQWHTLRVGMAEAGASG
jgi:hypothetical protein